MLTTTIQRYVDFVCQLWRLPGPSSLVLVALVVVSIILAFLWRYKSKIKKHVHEIDARLSRGLVYRVKPTTDNDNNNKRTVRCLELHPDFVKEQAKKGWKLTSLGDYLSSLRPFPYDKGDDIPELLQQQFEVLIGSLLLQHFGPRLGAVLLPMLQLDSVETFLLKQATKLAAWTTAHILAEQRLEWDALEDMAAAFPLSISEIAAFLNIHQKVTQKRPNSTSSSNGDKADKQQVADNQQGQPPSSPHELNSMEWMQRGEIGYSPSFSDNDAESPSCMIPNPFHMERDFPKAIRAMETLLKEQTGDDEYTQSVPGPNSEPIMTTKAYDPYDKSFPEPQPINESILPGLCTGWGNAQCTHTKREILQNRLLSILLTKLSYNYYIQEQQKSNDNKKIFVVTFSDKTTTKKCTTFPDEFIQALMESGHDVQVYPASTITTFGLSACIKEDDGSYSNIPIGIFTRTGYERVESGRPAYFAACHGGVNLAIQGPLLNMVENTNNKDDKPHTQPSNNKCDIQFYVAIEGLCGWHSNHNAQVPWIEEVRTTDVYNTQQALQAVRMAGLLSVTWNAVATEMELPFGGYGILGACNDAAAVVDTAIRGTTNMYPLISTGRFLQHSAMRMMKLEQHMGLAAGRDGADDHVSAALKDARSLVQAFCSMETDIHPSPRNLIGASRRYLANFPVSYFQLTEDSKQMMVNVATLWEDFLATKTGDGKETATGPKLRQSRAMNSFVNFIFNGIPQDNTNLIKEEN